MQPSRIARGVGKKVEKNVDTEDPASYLANCLKERPDTIPADFDDIILNDATSNKDRAFFIEVSDILRDQRAREIIRKNSTLQL